MKKQARRVLVLLPLCVLALASCEDTNELYKGDAYVTQSFVKNRYNTWDSKIKKAEIASTKDLFQYSNTNDIGYFSGSGKHDSDASSYKGLAQARDYASNFDNRKNDFKNNKGDDLYWTYTGTLNGEHYYDADIIDKGVGVWVDQAPLVNTVYGQTKKLSGINSKFSKGYLSKLYNGQIQCDAWSSYSLVELDQSGYGTMFPLELESSKYFAFSARGGSDTPSGSGRITVFDITVTFYKYVNKVLQGFSVTMRDVYLQTNYSAEFTALTGFYFEDVDYDPKGTVGMSMTYSIVKDNPKGYVTTSDFDNEEEGIYHIGLMLLEVFLPDSTWN